MRQLKYVNAIGLTKILFAVAMMVYRIALNFVAHQSVVPTGLTAHSIFIIWLRELKK